MSPSSAEARRVAVAVDRWSVPGGGLERYLEVVLPRLAAARPEAELILCAVDADAGTPPGCLAQVLREPFLPRPWADRRLAAQLRKRLARLAPDAVLNLRHLPVPGALWLPMGGLARAVEQARGRRLSARRGALLAMEEQAMRVAACALPSSPKVAAELAGAAPELAQELLPLPLLERPTGMATPYEDGAELRVVACGRDAARHGIEAALHWWLALRGRYPQARLDLWGKSLRHLEEALGEGAGALAILGVHLHGWDGLFSAALAEAHLFLHPTSYDSFSLACLEAAARGVPVVTTAGAGVAPLLPELLVATAPREDPGPAATVAAALLERHAAASAAERDAATAQVAADFDLDHHVIRLWELFDAQVGAVRD
ncbi:MAG: glycosyltransferase family 4 protein [Planctomycetota bacterium]